MFSFKWCPYCLFTDLLTISHELNRCKIMLHSDVFPEVKFWDVLLTKMGCQDRYWNQDVFVAPNITCRKTSHFFLHFPVEQRVTASPIAMTRDFARVKTVLSKFSSERNPKLMPPDSKQTFLLITQLSITTRYWRAGKYITKLQTMQATKVTDSLNSTFNSQIELQLD